MIRQIIKDMTFDLYENKYYNGIQVDEAFDQITVLIEALEKKMQEQEKVLASYRRKEREINTLLAETKQKAGKILMQAKYQEYQIITEAKRKRQCILCEANDKRQGYEVERNSKKMDYKYE